MKKSSIFSIATTLRHLPECYQLGIFIPPKVGNFTPPVTSHAQSRDGMEKRYPNIKNFEWIEV
jgi:hypothetical protein